MLDDDASGHIKRTHTLPRSIAVGDVVVGEFFALKLFVSRREGRERPTLRDRKPPADEDSHRSADPELSPTGD